MSNRKPMRLRSLAVNDGIKRKNISKRRRKATKHRTLMHTNISSQSSFTGVEESSTQPSESRTQTDSETNHIIIAAQINSPYEGTLLVLTMMNETSQSQPSFDIRNPMKIAVSYAGKTQNRVEIISQLVHEILTTPQSPFPIFYAPNFQGQLSGYNATDTLLNIYDNASLVVVFLSSAYTKSSFCQEEWRRIRYRFVHGKERTQRRRLIFVKLNKFNMKKMNLTRDDFFIDGLKYDNEQIADMIIEGWREVGKLSSYSCTRP